MPSGLAHHAKIYTVEQSRALTNMTSAHLMASAFAFAFYSYHNLLLFAYCVIINLNPHISDADVTFDLDSMPRSWDLRFFE